MNYISENYYLTQKVLLHVILQALITAFLYSAAFIEKLLRKNIFVKKILKPSYQHLK